MEIVRYTAPFACEPFLKILENEFGTEEALLERPQVNGSEAADNLDLVYVAKEGVALLATVHATIPKAYPKLCGVSAVCTVPSARGKGIGKQLFAKMMGEIDALGVETAVLGTSNPIAAKLYGSFGFQFLPGSFVMARFSRGAEVDFTRTTFLETPEKTEILPGSGRMRIQMIPLALHKGSQLLLDCNADIVDCRLMAQTSCIGLFPRYLKLREAGGNFYGAYNERGVLGAVASVLPTVQGPRADFYCCDAFEGAIFDLLQKCKEDFGPCYLQIAKDDLAKQNIAAQLGFRQGDEIWYSYKNVLLPCHLYVRC